MPELIINFSNIGTTFRNPAASSSRAEAHHALDTRPVVPATVEDHDLACGRQVRQIALYVHLGLLALGRRGERNDAKHPRTHPLGDRLDRAALAGAVAALEDDAHLEPLELDPLLQLDEFHMELFHLLARSPCRKARRWPAPRQDFRAPLAVSLSCLWSSRLGCGLA